MMRAALAFMVAGLAACAPRPVPRHTPRRIKRRRRRPCRASRHPRACRLLAASTPPAVSTARSVDAYKREVAQRIHEVSSERVFPGVLLDCPAVDRGGGEPIDRRPRRPD
jgi:hypothetical protein